MRLNIILVILISLYVDAADDLKEKLESNLDTLMPKVIEWRHDIHQYPELGNREFRTSNKIKFIESLGIIESGIAYTGLVGLIRGGQLGQQLHLELIWMHL